LPEELKNELDRQIDSMIKAGIIEPSKSAWGSAPVFVKKKTGEWRLCLDYRQVNKRMESDAYPIPLIWENLQLAAHHKFYICVDCNWGFWNIPLEKESRQYTALVTHRGMYEFTVLPFGLKNSPSEYQRAMDIAFGDLYDKGVLCYIDDIVIFGNTIDAVLELFSMVLQRCRDYGFYLKLSKSVFLKEDVKLLGHRIGYQGICADEDKVSAVQQAKPPSSKAELRSFLGTIGYLRRFIPHFSDKVELLTKMLRKREIFVWSEECEECFDSIKDELANQVLLSAPRGNGPFVIVADASEKGLGSALLQLQEGELMILEFASRKLTMPERKWDTREREAFAIRWAVERFQDYVKAGQIMVLTDHESLRWMENAKSGKVQRWALFLQQFNLKIMHIGGQLNVIADWLSRSLDDGDTGCDNEINQMAVPTFCSVVQRPSLPTTTIPYVPTFNQLREGNLEMSEEEKKMTYEGSDGLLYSWSEIMLLAYVTLNC